ncbi:unnamed protein product, partial [Tuber aestivum]
MGNLDDLTKAIKYSEGALAVTPQDHPNRAALQNNLGVKFSIRFDRGGDFRDLQNSIKHCENALAAAPQDPILQSQLGSRLLTRFKRMGDLGDLQKAINHGEEALASIARAHPQRASVHVNQGATLAARFDRMGDLRDLQEAIKHVEEALAATRQGHPHRAIIHSSLGGMHIKMFERTDDLGDVQKAITHSQDALAATPQDHPNRVGIHDKLGKGFSARFERIGELGDLTKAVKHSEEALAGTPQDHPKRGAVHNNLALRLASRFERMGDTGDLQKAVEHGEEALAATPHDDPDRARRHSTLGVILFTRFRRIGDIDLDDLQKAIKHSQESLDSTPQDHPDRAARHTNLGANFASRFERIGELNDLEIAIMHGEKALEASLRDHPERGAFCNNLGIWLSGRFKCRGNVDDIQKAIKLGKEALAATPEHHPLRVAMHRGLGENFSARFEQTGELGDLEKAIIHKKKALEACPKDHPDRATICTALGALLETRLSRLPTSDGHSECLSLYLEGFHCRTSPPRTRIQAARRAAYLLYSGGKFHESSSILEDAVSLMPSVNLRLLQRDDQQHILSELSGLASAAASMALQAGRKAYHSLKLLELGRGIIIGFAIDSRSEVSDLKADHPLEFNQFDRLRVEVDSPMNETSYTGDETPEQYRKRATSRRWEAVKEMEETLARIRQLPGYDGFLLPPPQDALMEMARNGPIIIFNSTSYRSDATIVTTSAITSLELPKLNYEKAIEWMEKLANFGKGPGGLLKRAQDNKKMRDLLLWLWDTAVGPVLDHLECNGAIISGDVQGGDPKHIWWVGVGQLSMAPFHAAGDHSRGSTRNTISRAISSYIPTIKALTYAPEPSRKEKPLGRQNPRLLLIPMPKTPGEASLPGVDREVQYIHDSTSKTPGETTVLSNPTPAKVLRQIQHHDIVHFACHGVSDTNPSDSHLLLLTSDGKGADKLLARDISNIVAQNAQLAYLSACSSAKNSSVILADEVIHLASAFQLAGFSHTLANLWETNDEASSQVARDFYNLLFRREGNGDGHHRVTAAFHQAVKKCRDKKPANFLTWAPFVHTG